MRRQGGHGRPAKHFSGAPPHQCPHHVAVDLDDDPASRNQLADLREEPAHQTGSTYRKTVRATARHRCVGEACECRNEAAFWIAH